MAGAIIIVSAIGVLLLVLTGYVIITGTLASADSVATAQKDMAALREEQQNTRLEVVDADESWTGANHELYIMVKNTGGTKIDISTVNFIVITQGSPPTIYLNTMGDGYNVPTTGTGTWNYDGIYLDDWWGTYETVNLDQLDPGEYLYVWVGFSPHPNEVNVFTPNGATGYLATS